MRVSLTHSSLGKETLIVISSDLSHYDDYTTAQRIDAITSQAILNANFNSIGPDRACGCFAINGLLKFAQHYPLDISLVDLRNSGDTAGDHSKVVGYGAYLFKEKQPCYVMKVNYYLTKHNKQRGCIGSLDVLRPLIEDVVDNSFIAAFLDSSSR